jgi:hypothetical protein
MRTHGTISCYQAGCTCAECRAASAETRQRHRTPGPRDFPCRWCTRAFTTSRARGQHMRLVHDL